LQATTLLDGVMFRREFPNERGSKFSSRSI
jgi:hypothetical protein